MLSPKGSTAKILRACREGLFELVVSETLLAELQRTLAYPKLRDRVPQEKAAAFVNWVRDHGTPAEDPETPPPVTSRDSDDDYLLALAIQRRAYLVTSDQDLLVRSNDFPILTPAQFATKLRGTRPPANPALRAEMPTLGPTAQRGLLCPRPPLTTPTAG